MNCCHRLHEKRTRSIQSLGLFFIAAACALAATFPSVAINADVAGRAFTMAGEGCTPGSYSAPQLLPWTPGASCTITFASPQDVQPGSRFVFTGWTDGSSSNPRTVTPRSGVVASFTATYKKQFQVTVAANPPGAGTLSGGGWIDSGGRVTLTQTPAYGYRFVKWTSTDSAAQDAKSGMLIVTGAATVTANYAPILSPLPTAYTISAVALSSNTGAGLAGLIYPNVSNSHPLNASGQVAGNLNPADGEPFLWTPITVNGTTGTLENFGGGYPASASVNDAGQLLVTLRGNFNNFISLRSPNGGGAPSIPETGRGAGPSLGNYGQVVTSQWLWIPTSANATTGTLITNLPLLGAPIINGFGQIVVGGSLLTPTASHGSTMMSTSLQNLAGSLDPYQQPAGINENGVIVGYSNFSDGAGGTLQHAFLWTPDAPNGTTGTLAEIPRPTGIASMTPTNLNDHNDVVGSMATPGGVSVPFLFSKGVVYDLAAAYPVLEGATPMGINNSGQIVFNAADGVYLATPGVITVPTPPSAVSMTPLGGTTSTQNFTFHFSSPHGYQSIRIANILINSALDGRQACYIAILPSSSTTGTAYLVNDAGDAGGPYAIAPIPGSAFAQNGQCLVGGSGATITGSGNDLTVTLPLTFKSGFTGNRIFYLAVQDVALNSGWQALGTWNVPGGTAPSGPAVTGVTPVHGSLATDTYTFTFTDPIGVSDLSVLNVLINDFLDGRQACYLAFVPGGAQLVGDSGPGFGLLNSIALPGTGELHNSQCTLSGSGSSITFSGTTLTLSLQLTFRHFSGNRVVYAAARSATANSDWQAIGTISVP